LPSERTFALGELARRLGGEVRGDPGLAIRGVRTLERAGPHDLSFVTRAGVAGEARASRAAALLVPPGLDLPERALVVVDDPSLALARAIELFHPRAAPPPGIHPTAVVGEGCTIDPTATIAPYAVIGDGAAVGERSVVGAHVVVGRGCRLGREVVLHPHVVLYDETVLGDRVVLHAGVVLGADGFGYATHGGEHVKVPQVGRTVVEDDVEIGALSAVDRAVLEETRVGRGTKIDNLVQVGHNVAIGRGCILCGQAGIAGSARLGDYVVVGGQSGVMGHHRIEDGTQIAGKSMAMEQSGGGQVAGIPAVSLASWRRQTVLIGRLGEMLRRIRALEKRSGVAEGDGEEGEP
jgi:UDP-3-O-[3-hydroxymyristoyl] glucosamine N-acyltransferase